MRHFATAVVLILTGWGTLASAQSEQSYSDAQINAAIEIGYDEDLDRIMHTCNASVGGFFNKLSEALTNAEGQPASRMAHPRTATSRSCRPRS